MTSARLRASPRRRRNRLAGRTPGSSGPGCAPSRESWSPRSAFDVLLELQDLHIGEAGEDVALVVDRHFLGGAKLRVLRDEGRDLAVLGAADADALLEARIGLLVGLRVGDIEHVVLVDPHRARAPELLPFGEQPAVE